MRFLLSLIKYILYVYIKIWKNIFYLNRWLKVIWYMIIILLKYCFVFYFKMKNLKCKNSEINYDI